MDRADKPGARIGPIVSATQFDTMQRYIKIAQDAGARLSGGGAGYPAGLEDGFFVRPTIFADVKNTMRIAQDDVFGTLSVTIPFDAEEDAAR